MHSYDLTTDTHTLDGIQYTAYGIRCGTENIADLSPCRREVEELVRCCNELELDPIHFHDVVMDFITLLHMADQT